MDLFPARQSVFTDKMKLLYGEAFATDITAPATVGFTAAQTVLDFRQTDGSNQANGYADTSGYVPVNSWDQSSAPTTGSRYACHSRPQGPPTVPRSRSS